jgi:basic amino acid/polyamine antiporter, APA family
VQNVGFGILVIGLLVTAIVVLLNSGDDFRSAFNSFAAPITGERDSYASIIAAADEAGANVSLGSNFSNTWPMLGAVLGFSIYAFYSTHISGEVRQASTWRTSGVMVGSTLINGVLVILMTVIFFHGFGTEFFTSINAINGSEAYPFAVPPFYVFLASIAGGSAFLAWILGISIVMTFFVVLWLQLVQPMRALFAYAFDGILPLKLAYVSPKSRVPVVSLGIVFVIILALYAWAVWGSTFFTVYATAVLFTVVALVLMSVSVITFAHRRPALWRSSVVSRRIGGLPLTTLAGIPALLIAILIAYLLLKYPGLGLTNRGEALRNVAIVVAAAIALYFVADAIRGRQGVRLSQAASEIPPD